MGNKSKKKFRTKKSSSLQFKQKYHEIFGPTVPSYWKHQISNNRKRNNKKTCDVGGVQRLHTALNLNCYIEKPNFAGCSNPLLMRSKHAYDMPTGLSPKERNYVICSCQSRFKRYLKLKTLVAEAIENNKIFTIYGNCNSVRKALVERGWIEKLPLNRMNLSKLQNGHLNSKDELHNELERLLLSTMVEKCVSNFIWLTKEEIHSVAIERKDSKTKFNKLKLDAQWTTKQGLCSSMKRNYWFYIQDVAEVNNPRTYNSYDVGDIEGFTKDFRLTACTSLLKWIISMYANERPIFCRKGQISLKIIAFAISRCKEYLVRKYHEDIDQKVTTTNSSQWNVFLRYYYRIIGREDVFEEDVENKVPLYLEYAKFLLKEIYKYRPQLSCEGCHDIWIIKPAHCSRGRGIRLSSKLGVITNLLNTANSKYVIQKYIEEPFLIYDTKFDIRQYYLVTNTYPLEIWMYRDCYLKFSSQKYNLKDYHESIHLTNNAIQKKYKNYIGRHTDLPLSNMWDLDKYKEYLNKMGKHHVWSGIIYPGMRKSIIATMLACQDSMSVSKNCFELYGCDFILDREYKPWLIEINSCPDLTNTTQITAKICPAVISDIIKVVIDHAADPNASTGKFECIYKQLASFPKYYRAADLSIKGYSLPYEYFYRGNIEIKESYDDPEIRGTPDINGMLNKLKQLYNSLVMVKTEPEFDVTMKINQETCTRIADPKQEIDINDIFRKTLNKLNNNSSSLQSNEIQSKNEYSVIGNEQDPFENSKPILTPSSKELLKDVKSLTDLNNCLSTTTCSDKSSDIDEIKVENFIFSKLDDGPLGNGSWIFIDYEKKSQ